MDLGRTRYPVKIYNDNLIIIIIIVIIIIIIITIIIITINFAWEYIIVTCQLVPCKKSWTIMIKMSYPCLNKSWLVYINQQTLLTQLSMTFLSRLLHEGTLLHKRYNHAS